MREVWDEDESEGPDPHLQLAQLIQRWHMRRRTPGTCAVCVQCVCVFACSGPWEFKQLHSRVRVG